MNKFQFIIAACATFAICNTALAYDLHTHTAMTSEAMAQSKFTRDPKSSAIVKQLGIRPIPIPFGTRYIDIGSQPILRYSSDFEAKIMKTVRDSDERLALPEPLTLTGWLMRGTIREDDNALETPDSDEPGGVFSRVYGHFYDPYNNHGLAFPWGSTPSLGTIWTFGGRSIDWALTTGTIANDRENHYKITDAREAMWRALTGKGLQNGNLITLPFSTTPVGYDSLAHQKEDERNAYWATTFRALGDVVHLLQDTAQPQHVRNDAHSGVGCVNRLDPDATCVGGHDSFIEKYIKARTLNAKTYSLVESFLPPTVAEIPNVSTIRNTKVKPLNYNGYITPRFRKYTDYFSTGTGADNTWGLGLANYSSRGFYSFGTNINSSVVSAFFGFPSPPPDGAGFNLVSVPASTAENMTGVKLNSEVLLVNGTVNDTVTNTATLNVKLSASGVWDQFLQQRGEKQRYTLNHYNYDDQVDLLIPRGVGYSAGLIDYFFRGDLKIDLPDEGIYSILDHASSSSNCKDNCGFYKIKLKLTNTTPDIAVSGTNGLTVPQDMTGGTLVAVVKYSLNNCYKPDLSGEVGSDDFPASVEGFKRCLFENREYVAGDQVEHITVTSLDGTFTLNKDQQKPLTFVFAKPIPINAWNVSLQVVYRGALGDEADAVVVTTKGISAPTYFEAMNMYDYAEANPLVVPNDAANVNTVHIPWQTTWVAEYKIKAFGENAATPTSANIASVSGLQPGSYARWAVLTNREPYFQNIQVDCPLCSYQKVYNGDAICITCLKVGIKADNFNRKLDANNFNINYNDPSTPNALPIITSLPVRLSRTKYRFQGNSFRIIVPGIDFPSEFTNYGTVSNDDPLLVAEDKLPAFRIPQPQQLTTINF